jgi:hypothetical protein
MIPNTTKALPGPVRVGEPAGPIVPVLTIPVLIQVPALRGSTFRTPARRLIRTTMRRRRRLRREVRMAGSALLLAVPLACTLMFLFAGDPEPAGVPARLVGIEGCASADEILWQPASIAPALPTRKADAPVVLPDYVLPDDGAEEPTHAGG